MIVRQTPHNRSNHQNDDKNLQRASLLPSWVDGLNQFYYDVPLWLEVRLTPSRRVKKIINQLRESILTESRHFRYMLTEEYWFYRNRRILDRVLFPEQHRSVFNPPKVIGNGLRPTHVAAPPICMGLDDQQKYRYEEIITNKKFRYLEVFPGQINDVLSGRLVTADIDDYVYYTAVSRRWGSYADTEVFLCDEKEMIITKDVASMVRNLRLIDETISLWIDEVCINQENENEKSCQVGIMDKIFERAEVTIIWLGEGNRYTESAFDFLHHLDVVLEKYYLDNWAGGPCPDIDISTDCNLPSAQDRRWLAMRDLLWHPWFTRAWTVQEFRLAKYPWIHCGRFCFPFNTLQRIIMTLEYGGIIHNFDLCLHLQYDLFTLHGFHNKDTTILLHILVYMARKATSVPKDKVFSVLGLACDGDMFKSILSYESSAEETFTRVASYYVTQGNMAVLNYATGWSFRNLRSLPSWVPDWSNNIVGMGASNPELIVAPEQPCVQPREPTTNILPRVSADNRLLTAQGVNVDQVEATGRTITIVSTKAAKVTTDFAFHYFEHWRHLALKFGSPIGNHTANEVFARTIVAGRHINLDGHTYASVYTMCVEWFCSRRCEFRMMPLYMERYLAALAQNVRMRTFFVTRDGHMGLGPYFIQRRDSVVHFDRGETPFLLRKAGKQCYNVVGGTYIHGMMGVQYNIDRFEDIRLV